MLGSAKRGDAGRRSRYSWLVLALVCLAVTTACGTSPRGEGVPASTEAGSVGGTVSYEGTPCPPDSQAATPPCSGPFAGFEVNVSSPADDTLVVATAITDELGAFSLDLPPGTYQIVVLTGIPPSPPKVLAFEVASGKTTWLDFTVDQGAR